MNIHEFQAKALFRQYGVATGREQVAQSAEEAGALAAAFGGRAVVKAQIHAGGRGKGGGVKFAQDSAQASNLWRSMMGMNLVTKQTGPEGRQVRTVLMAEPVDIEREFYLSLLVDRGCGKVALLASTEGGMDIEEVAASHPDKIAKHFVDPLKGLVAHEARAMALGLGLKGDALRKAETFIRYLYRLFIEKDCSLVEINPLVLTRQGEVIALDAKLVFDDNALFRHPDIVALRDPFEEAAEEIEASKFGLSFIKLQGNIGCMVNGAGLAMATMDIIQLSGGKPANFLDVGGGASETAIQNAFRIILKDPSVQAVLVNIFGGIMRCDIVASGIVKAAREMEIQVPIVVRLEGTNVEEGKRILQESGLALHSASSMEDAARKVVAAAQAANGKEA